MYVYDVFLVSMINGSRPACRSVAGCYLMIIICRPTSRQMCIVVLSFSTPQSWMASRTTAAAAVIHSFNALLN